MYPVLLDKRQMEALRLTWTLYFSVSVRHSLSRGSDNGTENEDFSRDFTVSPVINPKCFRASLMFSWNPLPPPPPPQPFHILWWDDAPLSHLLHSFAQDSFSKWNDMYWIKLTSILQLVLLFSFLFETFLEVSHSSFFFWMTVIRFENMSGFET